MKKKKEMKKSKEKFVFKKAYMLALVPVLSVALYLGMLAGGLLEEIYAWTVISLIAMSVIWGACGFLFARSRVTLLQSIRIGNILPIITTVVYFVLYIVSVFGESTTLMDIASVIGALGTGVFGVAGAVFYALTPFSIELLQVFVSLALEIIVFVIGYSIGGSIGKKKKDEKKKDGKKK